jgi:hypothetical protein
LAFSALNKSALPEKGARYECRMNVNHAAGMLRIFIPYSIIHVPFPVPAELNMKNGEWKIMAAEHTVFKTRPFQLRPFQNLKFWNGNL